MAITIPKLIKFLFFLLIGGIGGLVVGHPINGIALGGLVGGLYLSGIG